MTITGQTAKIILPPGEEDPYAHLLAFNPGLPCQMVESEYITVKIPIRAANAIARLHAFARCASGQNQTVKMGQIRAKWPDGRLALNALMRVLGRHRTGAVLGIPDATIYEWWAGVRPEMSGAGRAWVTTAAELLNIPFEE